MLFSDPCVFVVEREYQIVFNTLEPGIAWVECGGEVFRDSENGLMRSETLVHRAALPMALLDGAGEYTVCFRALPERRPYFPELGPVQKRTYGFRPVPANGLVKAVMLADTHSMIQEPCRAAAAAGEFDALLLNGDIPAESKRMEDIRAIYEITGALTHGEKPVVFARGNHDYRGRLATELTQFIGTRHGDTWFTFRLGDIWGIALDCGEDKLDTDIEYGGLVDCHAMRLRETAFLRDVLARADAEFNAPDVTTRIALCHIPFCTETMHDDGDKFDIERGLYAEWTRLLNAMNLNVMLCGHTHRLQTVLPDDPVARYGMNFPVIIGSEPTLPSRRDPSRPAAFSGICLDFAGSAIRADVVTSAGLRTPMITL